MMKHLTDNEIQSYLHGLTADEPTRIEDHLNDCSGCQKQLLLYKKLGDVVAATSSNPIPEGFETVVLGRLKSNRRLRRITDVIVAAVAFMGFALISSIVFLAPQLRQIATKYLMDAWQYGSKITTGNEGASDVTTLLAYSVILFVLFAAIDRLTTAKLRLATEQRENSGTD